MPPNRALGLASFVSPIFLFRVLLCWQQLRECVLDIEPRCGEAFHMPLPSVQKMFPILSGP